MQQYATDQLRNVVLLSQKGVGKTSLAEAMLHATGATSRLGKIAEGNTVSDFQPDEVRRSMSLNLAVLACEWKRTKLNLIDVPGDPDLVGEIVSGARVADSAVLLVDATAGVQVGTELDWKHAAARDLPVFFFANRMDRDSANFDEVRRALKASFGPVVAVQYPYGAAGKFKGVVDLLAMNGRRFEDGKSIIEEIPAELKARAGEMRDELVEAVASVDDELTEKYLSDQPITAQEMAEALKRGVAERKVFPLFCGAATASAGSVELLDALSAIAPSPAVEGVRPDAPLKALAFKTTVDPTMGRLTYLRVFAGELKSNSQVRNVNRKADDRVGQLSYPRGKEQIHTQTIVAGDICAVAKLSVTLTGDTLAAGRDGQPLAGLEFPEPSLAMAISPKTKSDLDKLGAGLGRMTEEDPTLRLTREEATNETLLWGMGDTHLHVAVDRLQRKFGTEVVTSVPKVPYQETVRKSTTAHGRYKRQTGGHGQFGDVTIILEPIHGANSDFEFSNEIVGGAISRNYVPAVEKGVREAMKGGILAGYPVVGCRVRLIDGKEHQVDSSDQAFQLAGALAFREAAKDSAPTLLEPIHRLSVTVPDSFTGHIIGDLNSKRARVSGTEPGGSGETVITAEAPLAETRRYALDLRQITQGRGTFTTQFLRYEEVPPHIQEQVIAAGEKRES